MKNIKNTMLILGCLISATAVGGNFTTFSFAADDTHDAPVFSFDAFGPIRADAIVNLQIDVNDDSQGGLVEFQSNFFFNGEIYSYDLLNCGSNWVHVWKVRGYFSFHHFGIHLPGALLRVGFEEAILTSASPYSNRVGQTFTLQVSDSIDPSLTYTPYARLIGAGVPASLSNGLDFAFTFTKARDKNQNQHIPMFHLTWTENFTAEGSFSGSGEN